MNYQKHYTNLINKARKRILEDYTEKHHIVPRCMGGSDEENNLVRLTPEEHYVAHQLLVKIYPDNKSLTNAALMMVVNRPSNKLYGWLRRKHAATQSYRQSGESNNQFGTRWIYNLELKENRKIYKTDNIPEGWIEGRKIKFDLMFYQCRNCGDQFRRQSLEIYCSKECKKHDRSISNKIIDENFEDMLKYYQTTWSIDKTLKHFGITGSRAGNNYFSRLLKEKNIYIRKRRNSS